MNKKVLIKALFIMIFVFGICLLSDSVQAAYISISLNKTTVNPGETITGTISSDCIGRVNLSSTNGTLSTDRVWIEGASQSFTVTVGDIGTASIIASAEGGIMSQGGTDIEVQNASTVISIATSSNGNATSDSSSSPNQDTSGNSATPEESNNANLSNLGIRPNDFTGFRPGTTTYNVTVPEDIENVEVYATAQDSGATISGTGNKTLKLGANALNVTVTAEDGTTKTYTINVTREGTEEKEEEQSEENTENTEVVNGLSNIEISGLQISPSFSTDVYEYTVNYSGEDTSLDMQAVPTDPNYTVEIVGNEELKEGENTITILVADSQGENVATYQVTVNKTAISEEVMVVEETQNNDKMKMLLLAGGIIAFILIIVIIIIIKRRKDRKYAEEFLGINDEEDDYDYDNYNDYNTQEDEDNCYSNNKDTFNNDDIENKNEEIENKDDFINENRNLEKNSIDDRKELEEKERAKIEFLNGYNTDYEEYSEIERTKRGRKKGKRFK